MWLFSLNDTFTWDSQPNLVEYCFAFPFLTKSFFVTHVLFGVASYCSCLANLERASYLPELSSNCWKPGRLGRCRCEGLPRLRAPSGHRKLADCDHLPFGLENATGALDQRYAGLSFQPFGWAKCRDLSALSTSLALRCLSWVKLSHCWTNCYSCGSYSMGF